jgi:hypothetical protein
VRGDDTAGRSSGKVRQDLVAIGNWQKLVGFVLSNETWLGSAEKCDDPEQVCTPLRVAQHIRLSVAPIPSDSSATHSTSMHPNSTTKKRALVAPRFGQ